MWLRDLVAPAFTNARIATYSYGSDWRDRQVNTSLRECGQQLLEVLLQHRQSTDVCCAASLELTLVSQLLPLINAWTLTGTPETTRLDRTQPWWACHPTGTDWHKRQRCTEKSRANHSQALVIAVHGPRYADLRLSVSGIVFLGTPFQGSKEATYAQWLAKLIRLQESEGHRYTLLKTLQKDSRELHNLSVDFWRSYGDYDMTCFYENRGADYGLISPQVCWQSAHVPYIY
jgi:hypothetical protein